MTDYIYLGPSPSNEPCVQTTDPDYELKAREECGRYADQLRRLYSAAHGGAECPAQIRVKGESHDFGTYFEVVARFNDRDHEQMRAAFWLDEHAPENWE